MLLEFTKKHCISNMPVLQCNWQVVTIVCLSNVCYCTTDLKLNYPQHFRQIIALREDERGYMYRNTPRKIGGDFIGEPFLPEYKPIPPC